MTIYAIKKNEQILIHTVAQWPRATIVTYLLQDMGQHIFCTDTDEQVDRLWTAMSNGAELVKVDISEEHGVEEILPSGLVGVK